MAADCVVNVKVSEESVRAMEGLAAQFSEVAAAYASAARAAKEAAEQMRAVSEKVSKGIKMETAKVEAEAPVEVET